ncbi:MAG: LptF/LptG family permease [Saprospiraceae bacterium]|nr:LptF/LptG family permease [Saprospiraceae bacterium]
MIKILDKLISKSFIGPSLLSFFVAIFVLVMQFLWKYIDEILGKGFTVFDLIELIFYFSVTLIPMALPITVLISSVMVYGDMAEKYELSSFKSAGVSMVRLLLPGFMIALLIAGFSFLSSNVLKPNANFQFQKRLSTLRNQKLPLPLKKEYLTDLLMMSLSKLTKWIAMVKTLEAYPFSIIPPMTNPW